MTKEKNSMKGSSGQNPANRATLSGVHDYFVSNVLPDDIQVHIRQIKAPTSYANNQDETFILVRSGTGKAIINGLEYALRPNTLMNLGPFHRYRYIPAKGTQLEIAEARMNSGTYMYMIANPYLKSEQFSVPSEPPVIHLSGLWADIANESMNGLLAEMHNKSSDKIQICFCYMMDFIGIITDAMPKGYFSNPKKPQTP